MLDHTVTEAASHSLEREQTNTGRSSEVRQDECLTDSAAETKY